MFKVKGRATVIIEHPSGEEVQWDWDERGACPWDASVDVSLLVVGLDKIVFDTLDETGRWGKSRCPPR